ncbi:hypothetical protein ELI41_21790 [Rhizobium leguminosarum]|uniref:restriction endonuclease subunit S n=1 Tax=Rhizobium leguminosarum TaxID=384 RepID=UPI00102F6921|nr:restriction endonuclease subunit S [Rhizobium leguminosarum]TAU90986.1 hypothetical protein ELI41_21790 [Rhizobium leguminosarum]
MTLPKGWLQLDFAEITPPQAPIIYGILQPGPEVENGVFYVRPSEIDDGEITLDDLRRTSQAIAHRYERSSLEPDDVILSIVGTIGKVAVVPPALAGANITQSSCRIRPDKALLYDRFLADFLRSPLAKAQFADKRLGTAVPRLNIADIREFSIGLPPVAEQRRIVSKLNALTARIALARAELDRVPVLAEKLRQSVVVDAFSGRLSEGLRRASPLKAEDDEHLDNLFTQRTEAKRKKPAAAIDWQPKLAIPDEWRWVSVDRVIAIAQYGSSSKTDENSDGVPVLRMGNIQSGELDFSNLKYLPLGHHEFPDLLLTDGDVLFNRTNSFELVGKSAVFRGASRPMSYASYLIRLQCCGILPDLLVRYLNSPLGRSWIESVASQQVGQANVNGTKLRSLGIPLPSEEEQLEMKRLMDVAFARADRLEAEAARAQKLLDRLESAILAKAFRGELMPQDPKDEPAEKLLERIRAQREAAPKPKRGRRTAS